MPTLLARQKEFTGYLVVGFPEFGLRGLPLKSACAVTGNATQENLVRPVTEGPLDHGSNGTMQWRLDRLAGPAGLRGWAKAHGLPWDTLRTQAAFFLYELQRDYPPLSLDLYNGTKPLETLTANISRFYERPAKRYEALDNRIKAAQDVYAAMATEPAAPTPPPLPPALEAITVAPHTSNVGWLMIAYGFACYFRITILGYPAEGDAIMAWLFGAYMLWSPDAKPEKALAPEPKDDKMSAQLDAFKAVVTDMIAAMDAVSEAHNALRSQAAEGAAVDQELSVLTDQFKQAVERLRALTN